MRKPSPGQDIVVGGYARSSMRRPGRGAGMVVAASVLLVAPRFGSRESCPLPIDGPPPLAAAALLPVSDARVCEAPPVDDGVRDWATWRAGIARKYEARMAKGPKRFDEPQAAIDFFMAQRLAPGQKTLPLRQLRTELTQIKLREAVLANGVAAADASAASPVWTEIGPGNIGGRTRSILIDPTDPNVMYAAGVAGGIWKSIDGGASWGATDDLMLNMAIASMAMDPNNSSVLYAGTGEGTFNGDALRGLGVFKSVDAGGTWAQLPGTVTGVPDGAFFRVNDVAVSPADSNRVYACTRFGVWRSTDAGGTWSVLLRNPSFLSGTPASNGSSAGCLDFALRSDTAPGADTIIAAFGSFGPDGLFRSTDNGTSWTQLGTAGDIRVANQGRMSLALAPSDNDVMYVSMADNGDTGNSTGTMVNVFRTIDGGNTWSARLNFANFTSEFLLSNIAFGAGCFGNSNFAQGWYDNAIAVDPADPNIVWVGGVDLYRSNDGGQNFGIASYWWFPTSHVNYVHADQHALVFHPDYNGTTNQVLYSGSDGGLARTDNARSSTSVQDCGNSPLPGITWTGLNNGYGVTQFYHGDSAKTANVFGGGCQDNGTNLVGSAVTPNSWASIFGGDGGYFAIDPTNGQIMYAETQGFPQMLKSTNGGASFSDATLGITDSDGLFITPFAQDQSDPNVLWTGGGRPWRTTDGASSWTAAGPDFAGVGTLSAIAVAPTDSNVVYLGFNSGHVVRTSNALAASPTWTTFGSANGLNTGAFVSSVAVDPFDPDIAYCTYSTFGVTHILRTANGGANWTSIDGIGFNGVPEIPVHWIAIRPCRSSQLFVGTELGVFTSDDFGATWVPANVGLAHTVVESLDFQDDHTLVAFTHGRGAFRTGLDSSECLPVCTPSTTPEGQTILSAAGLTVANVKNRYLSFSAGDPGRSQAVRVSFFDLPSPFDGFNGTSAWVDIPEEVVQGPRAFMSAILSPTPVFAQWASFGVVHVHDVRIVPSRQRPAQAFEPATYMIQVVDGGCAIAIPGGFSPPLFITNPRWGDIAELAAGAFLAPDGEITVSDTLSVLASFSSATGAPSLPRTDMLSAGVSGPVEAVDSVVDVLELLAVLDAFSGGSYPFTP